MRRIKFFAALFVANMIRFGLKVFGRKATYLPGKVAVRLCPDFLGQIAKPETIIGVTGTNGKTTVCNMVADILEEKGVHALSNRLGSNTNAGIASCLIEGSTLTGAAKYNIAIFELDERSARLIYPYVKPTHLICTNLFRDSIRRNAHAEYIADFLDGSIPPESALILNGDDLISCNIAPENKRVYFGLGPLAGKPGECRNIINDRRICPKCHRPLHYNYVHYHHIGNAECPNCDFRSPEYTYWGHDVDFVENTVTVRDGDREEEYMLVSDSLFNIYNMLAVIALFREMGYSHEDIRTSMAKIKIVETRFSAEEAGGTCLVTHMAKGQNPVACSRVFAYARKQEGKKEIILMLDDVFDAKDSSENITWLYDCDFEFLNDENITRIVIGGVRAEDYYLRLLIAGVPEDKLFYTAKELDTPGLLALHEGGSVYILYELYAAGLAFQVRDQVRGRILNGEGASK